MQFQDDVISSMMEELQAAVGSRGVVGTYPRINTLLHHIFEDDIHQLKFESNALDSGDYEIEDSVPNLEKKPMEKD